MKYTTKIVTLAILIWIFCSYGILLACLRHLNDTLAMACIAFGSCGAFLVISHLVDGAINYRKSQGLDD